jgi:hypothetical protein
MTSPQAVSIGLHQVIFTHVNRFTFRCRHYELIVHGFLNMFNHVYAIGPRIQNTKRNMRAFGSCANAPPAALWYSKQFPPDINTLFLFVCLTLFFLVPIYDTHSDPFLFSKEDFVRLPLLPQYKKHGVPPTPWSPCSLP